MVKSADTRNISQQQGIATLINGGNIDFFKSAEQTGTGAEQSIAHGLNRTPTLVWTEITSINVDKAGNITIVQGTHDATNVKVTAENDSDFKYIVYAC